MAEYSIVKTDFEKQKKELKSFAEQPATSTELDKFSTSGKFSDFLSGGLLGLIDHKVTGEEMNKLVTELQSCFTEINERDRKVIKEFGQVYETFEALDKGYIQGILIGVKSAEEASKEAKAAQKDIDDTIKALQATVKKLQEFKTQVNSNTHLKDVDGMWKDLKELSKNSEKLAIEFRKRKETIDQKIKELEKLKNMMIDIAHLKDIDRIWEDLSNNISRVSEINSEIASVSESLKKITDSFDESQKKLDQIVHLKDVDELWVLVQNINNTLESQVENLSGKIESIESSIDTLNAFSESQIHFSDVDDMWNRITSVESTTESHGSKLQDIESSQKEYKKSFDELKTTVGAIDQQEHSKEIDEEWKYSHLLGEKVEGHESSIEKLKTFSKSQSHFSDVDDMWNRITSVESDTESHGSKLQDIEASQKEYKKSFDELKTTVGTLEQQEHAKEIDEEWEFSHSLENKIIEGEKRISDSENLLKQYEERFQTMENENALLKGKISISYIVAGSAVGLSVIQLILSVLGIL